MIYGIGTDIVSIGRIQRILEHHPQRFPQRILHALELEELATQRHPAAYLARRFAAKEAIAKALGVGLAHPLSACDVCITHNARGAPRVVLYNESAKHFSNMQLWVSIADEKEYAIAYSVIMKATS